MASDTDRERGKQGQETRDEPESGTAENSFHEESVNTPGEPRVTKVEVLLLTFQHHDLPGLSEETEDVKKAFEQLNYSVTTKDIRMKKSLEELNLVLKDFLPGPDERKKKKKKKKRKYKDTLYIIYYHGHGYLNTANGQFTMLSHNYPSSHELCSQILPRVFDEMGKIFGSAPDFQRSMWERARENFGNLQPIAEITWGDISHTIMDAPCNTLVILDCCNAGLASAVARDKDEKQLKFRKELLGACTWGNATQDRMSPALCEALTNITDPGGAVSVSTLVRDMNKILVEQFVKNKKENQEQHVPQAVHFVLERTQRDRIILNRLKLGASD